MQKKCCAELEAVVNPSGVYTPEAVGFLELERGFRRPFFFFSPISAANYCKIKVL